jgi:hypothetical protein
MHTSIECASELGSGPDGNNRSDGRACVGPAVWSVIAVILIGIALRIWLSVSTDFSIGDSFIGYRFAEQFAAGNGLVFNAGESVGGNTSILYSLLLGWGACTGISIPIVARSIGITCDVLTFLLLWNILKGRDGVRATGLQVGIPALVYLCPILFFYSVSGMETPFYILTLIFFLSCTLRGVDLLWHLAMALVLFTRPDGILAVATALAVMTVQSRKIPWLALASTFVVGLAYLGFNYFSYGSIIPLTVKVKAEVFHNSLGQNFDYISSRFFFHRQAIFAAYLLLAAILVGICRRKMMVVLFGAAAAAYLLFVLFAPYVRTWYVVPFLTLSVCAILFALATLAEKAKGVVWKPVVVVALAIYLAASCYGYRRVFVECGVWRQRIRDLQEQVGSWLRYNTPADAKVFVTALETGYFCKRHTWDWPGLVCPKVLDFIKSHRGTDYGLLDIAEHLQVDYAVLPDDSPNRIHPSFRRMTAFGTSKHATHMGLQDSCYSVYMRVAKVPR